MHALQLVSDKQLEALREQLTQTQSRLDSAHQEIIRAQGEIAGLQGQLAAERGHGRHYRATIECDVCGAFGASAGDRGIARPYAGGDDPGKAFGA